MRKITALLVVVLLALGSVGVASAAKPPASGAMQFTPFQFDQYDTYIEQQTDLDWPQEQWVRRPAGSTCTWDTDDHWHEWALGSYLDANTTVTHETCRIAETNGLYQSHSGHLAWWSNNGMRALVVSLSSPSSALDVDVCFAPGGCFDLNPVLNKSTRRYDYQFCGWPMYETVLETPQDPTPEYPPEMVTIAGSNGGIGVPTDQTVTISNPTGRRIRNIDAVIEQIGWGMTRPGGCFLEGGAAGEGSTGVHLRTGVVVHAPLG